MILLWSRPYWETTLRSLASSSVKRLLVHHASVRKMATIINPPRDPNTLSNYNNFVTTQTKVDLHIDFDAKSIGGRVALRLNSITDANAKEILLDSSFLDIQDVRFEGKPAKWQVLPRFEPYGSALKITLENGVANGQACEVEVSSTKPFKADLTLTSSFRRLNQERQKTVQLYSS